MPIKFACEHCGARLSVSSRKAGAQAKCPKCEQILQIPAPARGEDVASLEAAVEQFEPMSAAGRPADDPLAQFLVYDSEADLIYATDDEESTSQAGFRASLDPHKVAVPRSILYVQGALLGLVTLMGLLIGILIGRGCSPKAQTADEGPQACLISGVVAIQDAQGETTPDGGAAVVIVPRDLRPEQQASMLGLRPQDPPPDQDHAGRQTLYGLGGDYARADAAGRFQLRVPDRGNYFLLVISAHAGQDDREQPKTKLAQIGRFFQLTPNMFEGHAIRWQEEDVQRDRQLNIVFPQANP
jgi:hypothetical protein